MSYWWAEIPSLIWHKAFNWLLLLCLFRILLTTNFKEFNRKFWTWVFVLTNALNYFFLLYFFIQNGWASGEGFSITYHEIKDLYPFFYYYGNYFSSTLVMLLPFYFIIRKWNFIHPKVIHFLMGIHVILIFMLNGRAATAVMLFMILAILFILRLSSHKYKKLVFGVFLFGLVGIIFLSSAQDVVKFAKRYNPGLTLQHRGGDDRLRLWEHSFEVYKEHAWLGVGSGNWKNTVLAKGLSEMQVAVDRNQIYNQAHSNYIEKLCELGSIGFLCFLLILVLPLFWLLKKRRQFHIVDASKSYQILGIGIISYLFLSAFYGEVYNHGYYISPSEILIIFSFAIIMQNDDFVSKRISILQVSNKIHFLTTTVLLMGCFFWYTWMIQAEKNHQLYIHSSQTKNYEEIISKYQDNYHPVFNQYYIQIPHDYRMGVLFLRLNESEKGKIPF